MVLTLVLGIALIFGVTALVNANEVNVVFQAEMPSATAIEVTVFPIEFTDDDIDFNDNWLEGEEGAAINVDFETDLTMNSETGVYASGHYYAIEIGGNGGGWGGPIQVDYIAGTNDLALHATATVQLMTYVADDDPTSTDVEKVRLDNISDLSVAQLTGHWPRIYIGLANGDEPAALNVEPFTAASTPGTYTGTLTFTYTGS
ncbi:MAG: hypothetical protein KAI91_04095 [Candidatus Omnitrophica bacterium]|nr:hypothetical protein [Candidatus Omnitrophota bacterium]